MKTIKKENTLNCMKISRTYNCILMQIFLTDLEKEYPHYLDVILLIITVLK